MDQTPPPHDSAPVRPVVRLRPKSDARAIRRGAPWVFDNELVLDRRTGNLPPGTIATLEDAERTPLGTVAVNPLSKIVCRMLDRDPDAVIDSAWLTARLEQALSHRARLYPEPFYRLIHAEADGLPGVVIDRFGDVAVIQPNAAWADVMLEPLVDALIRVTGVTTVVKNATGRARTLEGLDEETCLLRGTVDGPVPVVMNGATYMADVLGGQKTGLFLDQRPNHTFVAALSKDARMLDMFSHVGGFALAALAGGGAAHVLAVDGSAPALELATAGAEASGVADRFETRRGDAFDVLAALAEEGARFDVVVCDPPAFAPHKPALEAGLRAYERIARLGAVLVEQGGYLVLCSCSHAVDLSRFRGSCLSGIGRAGRRAQLIHTGFAGADHPQLPQLAESGYLKVLVFRLVA